MNDISVNNQFNDKISLLKTINTSYFFSRDIFLIYFCLKGIDFYFLILSNFYIYTECIIKNNKYQSC